MKRRVIVKVVSEVSPVEHIKGELSVAPDKSITHRALMISALAEGTSYIHSPLIAKDVESTIRALQMLGVSIEIENELIKVTGKGMYGLREPKEIIDAGNSGTTIRLLLGILAAQPFPTVLMGDSSLVRRPMGRVVEPLRSMGAFVDGRSNGNYIPIIVHGRPLKGITYQLPVHSAQVKSAILLAGMFAEDSTTIIEPIPTRDHTERMLRSFGVPIQTENGRISISTQEVLHPHEIRVPGDFSSAAYFIAAALLAPKGDLILRNVGINPTRTGLLTVLKNMGAKIEIFNIEYWDGEPVADLRIQSQPLKGTIIEGNIIPSLIDEIPILALIATQAEGVTEIHNAEELRVKETNRIRSIVLELSKMGAEIEELHDGLRVVGKKPLKGTQVHSHHDHRIAMTLSIAGLIANDKTTIDGIEAIHISYPDFLQDLAKVSSV